MQVIPEGTKLPENVSRQEAIDTLCAYINHSLEEEGKSWSEISFRDQELILHSLVGEAHRQLGTDFSD